MSLTGKIARILDESRFVINIGSEAGVKSGQEFIIYQEGDEIFDPETNESLGKMELSKGAIVIEHVQEKLSIAATKVSEKKVERKNAERDDGRCFCAYGFIPAKAQCG